MLDGRILRTSESGVRRWERFPRTWESESHEIEGERDRKEFIKCVMAERRSLLGLELSELHWLQRVLIPSRARARAIELALADRRMCGTCMAARCAAG